VIHKFWHIIDTGGLVCQLVFYPLFLASGLLMLLTGAPTSVFDALGSNAVEAAWIFGLILPPVLVLIGANIRNRFFGIAVELGANVTLMGALIGYSLAITQSVWLDKGAFSPWLALGAAEMVFFICLRDARRLIRSEKRARREST